MSSSLSKSDKSFLRQFGMVVGALHVVAGLLLLTAWAIYSNQPEYEVTVGAQTSNQRIAPVGGVYAGDTGRAAMQAAQEAAAKAAASQVAYGGSTDGKTIYDNLCGSCHTAGVAGAPKVGDAANWVPRIAQGMDTLIKHAIDGYTGPDGNHMPAKGGNPALTDEQVAAAVKWMAEQSQ